MSRDLLLICSCIFTEDILYLILKINLVLSFVLVKNILYFVDFDQIDVSSCKNFKKKLSPIIYSWHEIGVYDLTAKIDYILETTGQSDLFYVGHSQGTTSFYVMASERPEYNNKIRLMVSLAPVAYMSHMVNPFFQELSKHHTSLKVCGKLNATTTSYYLNFST